MTMNDNIALDSVRRSSFVARRVKLDPSKVRTVEVIMYGKSEKMTVVEEDFIDYMEDGRRMFNGQHEMS